MAERDGDFSIADVAAALAASFEDLSDDSVKLVAYTLVCLEYGSERILEKGTGQVLITEPMTREQFIAQVFFDYAQKLRASSDLELLEEYDRVEPGALGIHFAIARKWPKRKSRLEVKQIDALNAVSEALPPAKTKR